jgi:hypothetical protein
MKKAERLQIERKKTEQLLKQVGYKTPTKQSRQSFTNMPSFLAARVSQTYYEEKNVDQVCVGDMSTGNRTGIMANLHLEPEHVKAEILRKASCVAIAYNKGGYQYITPESDPSTFGKK